MGVASMPKSEVKLSSRTAVLRERCRAASLVTSSAYISSYPRRLTESGANTLISPLSALRWFVLGWYLQPAPPHRCSPGPHQMMSMSLPLSRCRSGAYRLCSMDSGTTEAARAACGGGEEVVGVARMFEKAVQAALKTAGGRAKAAGEQTVLL